MLKLSNRGLLIVSFASIMLCASPTLGSEDVRTDPIDIYLLIDRSVSMRDALPDVAEWLCERVVDRVVRQGDRVSVWTFSSRTELLFEDRQTTPESSENMKKAIRSLKADGDAPDIASAIAAVLREAEARNDTNRLSYMLLASSLLQGDENGVRIRGDEETSSLLKFSRIEDRPGWKAVIVGLGIGKQVKTSASDYLRSAPAPR